MQQRKDGKKRGREVCDGGSWLDCGTHGVVVTVPHCTDVFKVGLTEDILDEFWRHRHLHRCAGEMGRRSKQDLLRSVCLTTAEEAFAATSPLLGLGGDLLGEVARHVATGDDRIDPSDLSALRLPNGGVSWVKMARVWKAQPAQLLEHLAQLLRILTTWRDLGLVHCDLSASNIVCDGSVTRLVDLKTLVSWAEACPTAHVESLLRGGLNPGFSPELSLLCLALDPGSCAYGTGAPLQLRSSFMNQTLMSGMQQVLYSAVQEKHRDESWLSLRGLYDAGNHCELEWHRVEPRLDDVVEPLAKVIDRKLLPSVEEVLCVLLPHLTVYQFGAVVANMCVELRSHQSAAERAAFSKTQDALWDIVGRCTFGDWNKRPSLEALRDMVQAAMGTAQ